MVMGGRPEPKSPNADSSILRVIESPTFKLSISPCQFPFKNRLVAGSQFFPLNDAAGGLIVSSTGSDMSFKRVRLPCFKDVP